MRGHYTREPSVRKPHRDFAGYVTERRNPVSGDHVVILDCRLAAEQGTPLVEDWDEEGGRWQVLCNGHATILHTTSERLARSAMIDPASFCEDCRGPEVAR